MTTILIICGVLAPPLIVAVLVLIRSNQRLRQDREALDQSQKRIRVTLHSCGIAIWNWDIERNIVTADDNCSILFGLPLGEFPRTFEAVAERIHPDDRDRMRQEVIAAVREEAEFNTEHRILWPAGTLRHIRVRAKSNHEPGQPRSLTGICTDVTDRRLATETLQAANEKLSMSLRELERRKKKSAILSEMADLLQACSNSAEAYTIVAQFCAQLFPNCAGTLYIFSFSRNLVNSVVTWNDPVMPEENFDPGDCWALRRGRPHITVPSRFATPCRHLTDIQRGHACFPLMAQGNGLGTIYLQGRQRQAAQDSESFLSAEDQQLALNIAEQVALSVANLHLREALRLQTIRDPLTGLYNRRYLEESVERELHRMARREQPAGFLMIDLDCFKTFNDTFGHAAGDALLRVFGQFLREHLRKEDIACRYGGEEFCILLSESALDNTVRLAEQLRSRFKQLGVQHEGQLLSAVTMSIGVASYPNDGTTLTDLIAAADGALYQAKAHSRDCVVVAGAPPSTSSKIAIVPRGPKEASLSNLN